MMATSSPVRACRTSTACSGAASGPAPGGGRMERSSPERVHSRTQARPPSWLHPLVSSGRSWSARGDHLDARSAGSAGDAGDRVVDADLAGEDRVGERGRRRRTPAPRDRRVLQDGVVDHDDGSLLAATVNRHGSGSDAPTLVDGHVLAQRAIRARRPTGQARRACAMPRLRPGHACGPAPNGQPGARAPRPVLPAVGVEAGEPSGSPGTSSARRPRSRGLTSTTRTRRDALAAESTSRVVTRAVIQVGGVRRSVSHTAWTGSTSPRRVVGEPGQQPRARGDRDLDAGGQHGRRLLRRVPCEVAAIASARASSSAMRARRARRGVRGSTARAGGGRRSRARARRSRRARGRRRGRGRRRSSVGSTAAVVDRATGRRSSTMASYGSPGAVRSCSASAGVPLARRRSRRPRATWSGRQRGEDRWPDRVSPAAARTGRRCG